VLPSTSAATRSRTRRATFLALPSRDTYVVLASNAAANYNDTALAIQLLQMSTSALLEFA